jgi:thiosulfate reductase cytochrome b subunit
VSVVVAALMYAILSSPPLAALLLVAWLCGAEWLLLLPVVVWLVATVWLSANAGVRARRLELIDALVEAPRDVVEQLMRLVGLRRKGLRAV